MNTNKQGGKAMRKLQQNECFQAIDLLLNKLSLIEDKVNLRINSEISQSLQSIQIQLDTLDLLTHYTENYLHIYNEKNENLICN